MLHEVSGDILLSRAAVLAHGVAPGDDWKAGLNRALRERFPAMVTDFRHHCHAVHPEPGTLWTWSGAGPLGPVRIANLLTQDPPARPGDHPGKARLEHVHHALKALRAWAAAEKVPSLAITRIATGVGGLTWDDVRPLVVKHLGSLEVPVYVYVQFVAGVQANEPGLTAPARAAK